MALSLEWQLCPIDIRLKIPVTLYQLRECAPLICVRIAILASLKPFITTQITYENIAA